MKKTTTNLTTDISNGSAEIVMVDKFGGVLGNAGISITLASLLSTLGYTPEDLTNKTDSLLGNTLDSDKYLSTKGISEELDKKQPIEQKLIQISELALLNTTVMQAAFSGGLLGDGALPVIAGQRYAIIGHIQFQDLSPSSKQISFGFLGTALATDISIHAFGVVTNATGVATAPMSRINTLAGAQVSSSATAPFGRLQLFGTINVTNSGSLIPSVAFTSSTTTMKTTRGSFLELIPLGASSNTY
jgi:hypothetical protein